MYRSIRNYSIWTFQILKFRLYFDKIGIQIPSLRYILGENKFTWVFFFFYIKWYILPSNSTRSLSAARVFLSPRCPPWSGKVAVISPNSLSSLQCLAKYPPSNCATIQILFVQYIKFFLKKTLLRNSVYSGVRMFVWLWPSWITSPSFSRHEESVHFLYFSSVTMAPCS